MKRIIFLILAYVLTLPLSTFVFSQSLPPAITIDKVSYITGGIGKTEADAMRRAASDYPLALMLSSSKDGHFVTDVELSIQTRDGVRVLHTDTAGPIVLARLPKGHYRIEARYQGRVLVREVDVDPAEREMLYLNWPA